MMLMKCWPRGLALDGQMEWLITWRCLMGIADWTRVLAFSDVLQRSAMESECSFHGARC